MSTRFVVLSVCSIFVLGCSSNRVLLGERADGLTVECEEDEGDDVYQCETNDEDDVCEDWVDGGSAFVLWPPNHKLHTFSAADCLDLFGECTDPDGDPIDGVWGITGVTSDEPIDVGAGGDGHTTDFDMAITDDGVLLRSERQGGGDGRVYRIEMENDLGDALICEVHVPHNRGPFGGAVDSGESVRVDL